MSEQKPEEMSWATLNVTIQELEKEILMAIVNLGRTGCPKTQAGVIERLIDKKQELDRERFFRLAENDIYPRR